MDVFDLRGRLVADYQSYTRSFIKIRDERIRRFIDHALTAGAFWPEPLLQLNPTFLPGGTIDDLVADKVLHAECAQIFRIDKSDSDHVGKQLPLHEHQRQAILTAKEGKSYVLTSGTGSGKSLAYIVPIVDHVLRNGSGRGIQAIVVYPMNALANSQDEELGKFLKKGYPEGQSPVRFARYTGQEKGEVREALRREPPDILLTNYMMLELLLTRSEDRELVRAAKGLPYLVFDELHTYRGRQGADVALLIRRCRQAFSSPRIICVGTSATMASGGTSDDQRREVARVAESLFGVPFSTDQVIGETLERATPQISTRDTAAVEAIRTSIASDETPPTEYEEFHNHKLASWIESTFGIQEEPGTGRLIRQTPRRLQGEPIENQKSAAAELAELTGTPAEACATVLRRFGRCLYGVDMNPMAAELCRVGLWLEALEPGKPLSFLDHHIRVGNSLLGATPELIAAGLPDEAFTAMEGDEKKACTVLRKRNKAERKGMGPLFARQDAETQARLQQAASALEELPDDRPEDVRAKEMAFRRHEETEDYRHKKRLADTWCAAFVIRKYLREPGREASASGITQSHLNDLASGRPLLDGLASETERLSGQYQFFHWHLAFPEVFAQGGFDVVLGNPPWERVKLQEKEWFAERNPKIANAPSAAARKRMIDALKLRDPALHQRFLDDSREADGESHLMRNSGRYPFCGRGDINTYAVFAEGMRNLLGPNGRLGCVLPTGIATDDTTKLFFHEVLEKKSLVSLFDFENEGFFPAAGQGHMTRFCLFSLAAEGKAPFVADFAFRAQKVEHLLDSERRFTLSADDITLLNPNTHTCPTFRSRRDAELTKAIYRRVPILFREAQGVRHEVNLWGIQFSSMFHMSNDSHLFRTKEQLETDGWRLKGNVFCKGSAKYLPLYEAKMVQLFNHRFGDFSLLSEGQKGHILPDVPDQMLRDATYQVLPQSWVSFEDVESALGDSWRAHWLIGFRNVANDANARTLLVSLFPLAAVGNSLPLIFFGSHASVLAPPFLATLSSFAVDYAARQKMGGTNLNFFIFRQLPVLPPSRFSSQEPWSENRLGHWVLPRVLELTYTAWDLEPFAQNCGWFGPPFRWDETRRFLLRCELDAAFFHLYLPAEKSGDWKLAEGETAKDMARVKESFPTPRDAAAYIMDTFPIVRRNDEEKHGEYRTKRVILEVYDSIHEAIRTDGAYRTRLNPPPADPRCCHPAQNQLRLNGKPQCQPRSQI